MIDNKKRPVFLNLIQIRLPIAGIMSIAHRIAGVLLFVSLPFWLYLLDLSLTSESGYQQAAAFIHSNWLMPFYILLFWSIIHHLLAGVRYLLLDVDIAIEKPAYRKTALFVLIAAPVIVLLTLLVML